MKLKSDFLFLAQDERGYFAGLDPHQDQSKGFELLKNLTYGENGSWQSQLEIDGHPQKFIIEAYDQPLMVHQVHLASNMLTGQMSYGWTENLNLAEIKVDEWDRYLIRSERGFPCMLLPEAQNQMFNLAENFTDDSISLLDSTWETPPLWSQQKNPVGDDQYWSCRYNEEVHVPWDLEKATPVLMDIFPKLKMPKSKILVLGCGTGQDALFLAQMGHLVTAVDFSESAIKKAQAQAEKVQHLISGKLEWIQSDVFQLPTSFRSSFDVIFEHTLFCAVDPNRRNQLVQIWHSLLRPGGSLLGVFFTMDRENGPPFGGTEWEIQKRFEKKFQVQLWERSRKSIIERLGKELLVMAAKPSTS